MFLKITIKISEWFSYKIATEGLIHLIVPDILLLRFSVHTKILNLITTRKPFALLLEQ